MAATATKDTAPADQPVVPGSLPSPRERRALASLILGISGLFFSIVAGIPAIILGRQSLAEIKKSSGNLSGEGMAMAGQVLGWISVALVPFLLMIAIPNFHHSMSELHWEEGAGVMRSLISAEKTYLSEYPKAGYAPDLATLGPGGVMCESGEISQQHACMIDGKLGCVAGTSGNWCERDQYRYSIVGFTKNALTENYVITSTPTHSSGKQTSYCATSDGVVRFHAGIVTEPIKTVAECSSWTPL